MARLAGECLCPEKRLLGPDNTTYADCVEAAGKTLNGVVPALLFLSPLLKVLLCGGAHSI